MAPMNDRHCIGLRWLKKFFLGFSRIFETNRPTSDKQSICLDISQESNLAQEHMQQETKNMASCSIKIIDEIIMNNL